MGDSIPYLARVFFRSLKMRLLTMNKFTPEQISHMLSLQDELNCLIHPEWKLQNFDWNTAILDECQELLGWLGWKWWKDSYECGLTEQNKKQIQVEVIDILHFYLSLDIVWSRTVAPKFISDCLNCTQVMDDWLGIHDLVYRIRRAAANNEGPYWTLFGYLIQEVELSPTQVYETYIAKYTLNIFRQNHGYKTGEYKKHWLLPVLSLQFQEDNWFLEKALEEIKKEEKEVTTEEINNRLEYWYGILEGGK